MKKQHNSLRDMQPHSRPLETSCIFQNNKVLILASLDDKQYYELLKIFIPSNSQDIKQ